MWWWLLGTFACWLTQADLDKQLDRDGDGVPRPEDCNDNNPNLQRRMPLCPDDDGDGRGDPDRLMMLCAFAGGAWVEDCTDCDDTDLDNACDEPCPPLDVGMVLSPLLGEARATSFRSSAVIVSGDPILFAIDWGDGVTGGPAQATEGTHVYEEPGVYAVVGSASDECGETTFSLEYVAVGPAGERLTVTTSTDEDQSEVFSDTGDYLGDGLSLREAIALANELPGPQLITFRGDLEPLAIELGGLTWNDPGGMLIGNDTVLSGADAGQAPGQVLKVDGPDSLIANLTIDQFTTPDRVALMVNGANTLIQAVEVHDSTVAMALRADGITLRDSRVIDNQRGIRVAGHDVRIEDVEVRDSSYGVRVGEGSVRLEEVVIVDCSTGVVVSADVTATSIVDSTLAENGSSAIEHLGTLPESFELRNTAIVGSDGWGFQGNPVVFEPTSPSHNLWWDNDVGDCQGCSAGPGGLTIEPGFVDGTILPSLTSALIDAGTVETDVDRTGPLPGAYYGVAPEIGAVELRP